MTEDDKDRNICTCGKDKVNPTQLTGTTVYKSVLWHHMATSVINDDIAP